MSAQSLPPVLAPQSLQSFTGKEKKDLTQYEYVTSYEHDPIIPDNNYLLVRVDGRRFKFFSASQSWIKPIDDRPYKLMIRCAAEVMQIYQGNIICSTTQSDEVTFVFRCDISLYNRRIEKIVTTIASTFTSYYIYLYQSYVNPSLSPIDYELHQPGQSVLSSPWHVTQHPCCFPDLPIATGYCDSSILTAREWCQQYGQRYSQHCQCGNYKHDQTLKLDDQTPSSLSSSSSHRNPRSPYKPPAPALPVFDGKAILLPTIQHVYDYFSWRQVDAHINNQYNTLFYTLLQTPFSSTPLSSTPFGSTASICDDDNNNNNNNVDKDTIRKNNNNNNNRSNTNTSIQISRTGSSSLSTLCFTPQQAEALIGPTQSHEKLLLLKQYCNIDYYALPISYRKNSILFWTDDIRTVYPSIYPCDINTTTTTTTTNTNPNTTIHNDNTTNSTSQSLPPWDLYSFIDIICINIYNFLSNQHKKMSSLLSSLNTMLTMTISDNMNNESKSNHADNNNDSSVLQLYSQIALFLSHPLQSNISKLSASRIITQSITSYSTLPDQAISISSTLQPIIQHLSSISALYPSTYSQHTILFEKYYKPLMSSSSSFLTDGDANNHDSCLYSIDLCHIYPSQYHLKLLSSSLNSSLSNSSSDNDNNLTSTFNHTLSVSLDQYDNSLVVYHGDVINAHAFWSQYPGVVPYISLKSLIKQAKKMNKKAKAKRYTDIENSIRHCITSLRQLSVPVPPLSSSQPHPALPQLSKIKVNKNNPDSSHFYSSVIHGIDAYLKYIISAISQPSEPSNIDTNTAQLQRIIATITSIQNDITRSSRDLTRDDTPSSSSSSHSNEQQPPHQHQPRSLLSTLISYHPDTIRDKYGDITASRILSIISTIVMVSSSQQQQYPSSSSSSSSSSSLVDDNTEPSYETFLDIYIPYHSLDTDICCQASSSSLLSSSSTTAATTNNVYYTIVDNYLRIAYLSFLDDYHRLRQSNHSMLSPSSAHTATPSTDDASTSTNTSHYHIPSHWNYTYLSDTYHNVLSFINSLIQNNKK